MESESVRETANAIAMVQLTYDYTPAPEPATTALLVFGLAALLCVDHIFVDSVGNRVQGHAAMQAGWRGCALIEHDTVLAVGEAGRHDRRLLPAHAGALRTIFRSRRVANLN